MEKTLIDIRPELYMVYDFDGIQKVCPGTIQRAANGQFPIPTEVIIGIGEKIPPLPYMGRMWRTQFYKRELECKEDSLYTPREIRTFFSEGVNTRAQAIIVETYSDWGSDGHIDYDISGYKIILYNDFKTAIEEINNQQHYRLHKAFTGIVGEKHCIESK